jgi:hypothetical protein
MLGLLLPLLAPAAAIAGLYQSHQMEIGAALELQPSGHFRYQLDYGAVSEHAEGNWTFDGKTVRLTTRPAPKAPSFDLVRDDAAPAGDLALTLEPPGFGEGYRLDAIATDAAGARGMVSADDKGKVEAGGHRITMIEPIVPVYGGVGGRFALSSERGHRLLLRFHANDIDTAAFAGEPLVADKGGLILKRYETEIRFARVRP